MNQNYTKSTILLDENIDNLNNILKENHYVLIQYGSKMCGPCYSIRDKISRWIMDKDVLFVYVDIEENMSTAVENLALDIPHLSFYIDGTKYCEVSKIFSLNDFFKKIERYISLG